MKVLFTLTQPRAYWWMYKSIVYIDTTKSFWRDLKEIVLKGGLL